MIRMKTVITNRCFGEMPTSSMVKKFGRTPKLGTHAVQTSNQIQLKLTNKQVDRKHQEKNQYFLSIEKNFLPDYFCKHSSIPELTVILSSEFVVERQKWLHSIAFDEIRKFSPDR